MFLHNNEYRKPIETLEEAFEAIGTLQEQTYFIERLFNDEYYSNAIIDFNYKKDENFLLEEFNFNMENFLNESGDDFTGAIAPNSKAKEIARYGFRGKPKNNTNSNNASSSNTQSKPNETKKDNDTSKNEDKTKGKGPNRSNSKPETAKELKDKGRFLWNNVKAFAKNVWEKIKELCKLIFRKVKEWTSSYLDTFNKNDTEITRSEYELLTRLPRILEKALAIATKSLAISEGGVERAKDQVTEVGKEIEEVVRDANKKTGNIKVGKNWLKTMSKVIQQLTTKLDKGNDLLQKQLDQVERVAGKAKSNDVSSDAQKAVGFYNAIAVLFRNIASKIVEISNALLKSINQEKEDTNNNQQNQTNNNTDNNNTNNNNDNQNAAQNSQPQNNNNQTTNNTTNNQNPQPTNSQTNAAPNNQPTSNTNNTPSTAQQQPQTPPNQDTQTNSEEEKKNEEIKKDLETMVDKISAEVKKPNANKEEMRKIFSGFIDKHGKVDIESLLANSQKESDKNLLAKYNETMKAVGQLEHAERTEGIIIRGTKAEQDAKQIVLNMHGAMKHGESPDVVKGLAKDINSISSLMDKVKRDNHPDDKRAIELWNEVEPFIKSNSANAENTESKKSALEEKIEGTDEEKRVKEIIVMQHKAMKNGEDYSFAKHAKTAGLYSPTLYNKVVENIKKENKAVDQHIITKLKEMDNNTNQQSSQIEKARDSIDNHVNNNEIKEIKRFFVKTLESVIAESKSKDVTKESIKAIIDKNKEEMDKKLNGKSLDSIIEKLDENDPLDKEIKTKIEEARKIQEKYFKDSSSNDNGEEKEANNEEKGSELDSAIKAGQEHLKGEKTTDYEKKVIKQALGIVLKKEEINVEEKTNESGEKYTSIKIKSVADSTKKFLRGVKKVENNKNGKKGRELALSIVLAKARELIGTQYKDEKLILEWEEEFDFSSKEVILESLLYDLI